MVAKFRKPMVRLWGETLTMLQVAAMAPSEKGTGKGARASKRNRFAVNPPLQILQEIQDSGQQWHNIFHLLPNNFNILP
ncbi:hypothetical protein L6452_16679 [Arctium lappa]|uniref:Uncharacterized protein n=1 Tax=Arctium lappa TaxID=4217 RepID=A0ACB9C1B0_ARCLA|nr:hypothetical protein L6452_16679 [Arctium lappa]